MELRLAVVGPEPAGGTAAIDVVVDVEPEHTVGEVAAALAAHVGLRGGGWSITRPATGEEFDTGELVGGLGLTDGNTLVLGRLDDAASSAAAAPGVDSPRRGTVGWWVEVVGGPDLGRRRRLDPGTSTRIGRDPGAEFTVRDPSLGRLAVELRTAEDGTVTVVPGPGPGIEIAIDGEPVAAPMPWTPGRVLRCAATEFEFRRRSAVLTVASATTPTVPVHRAAGQPPPPAAVTLALDGGVPSEPEPTSFAYLAAAMPLAMGLALAVLYSPRFLLFAVFSPVVAVGGYLDQRRRRRNRQRRIEASFDRALGDVATRAVEALTLERRQRRRHVPDLAELAHRIERRDARLWGRRLGVEGAPVRCGHGTITPLVTVEAPTGGDEPLQAVAAERLDPVRHLADVPIAVDLVTETVINLAGPSTVTAPLANALLLQAACHHPPGELVIAAARPSEHNAACWLPWLPHARAAERLLDAPALAETPSQANALAQAVLRLADTRAADTRSRTAPNGPATIWRPRVLVAVEASLVADPSLRARLGGLGGEAGVSLLWLTATADTAPATTTVQLRCPARTAGRPARLHHVPPSVAEVVEFEPDGLEPREARRLALGLAPLVDAAAPDDAGVVPSVTTLAEVLGPGFRRPEAVAARWARPRSPSLAAPVGVGPDGVVALDLVVDGPHCLIGGTSGSGKSELTMSFVAALVAEYPPDRLNVLFVDYEGGATGQAFAEAPHTVGCVTNLDGALAQRALVSLRAELQRRMDLLRGRAKDVDELAAIDPTAAPPALVIVIDEFATLVAEVPSFMAGIIDLAQRGRSLGIHLLLATQRPAAAVSDDILANTSLRICLRTIDGVESTSVLGLPDAARIDPQHRGRALVRRGPGTPTVFQAAWSAAPVSSATIRRSVSVRPLLAPTPPPPDRSPHAGPGPPVGGGRSCGPTELDQLLEAVRLAAEADGRSPAPPPWLPELPTTLPLDGLAHLATVAPVPGPGVDVGLIDDPARQARRIARIDLAGTGGLLIVGAGGSGKTTALVTVAAAAASTDEPPVLFALDFAGRRLTSLDGEPHCAAVAVGDDLEAVTRLIAVLEQEVVDRRAGRLDDQRPLLLLIDDYGALTQTFEGAGVPTGHHQWLERLNRLIVDGRQVGLATVVAADRRATVRAALWSALGARLVLRCVDESAYRDLGVDPHLLGAQPPPGRGILDGCIVQLAMPSTTGPGHPPAPPAPTRLVVRALPGDLTPAVIAAAAPASTGPVTGGTTAAMAGDLTATCPATGTAAAARAEGADGPAAGRASLVAGSRSLSVRVGLVDLTREPLDLDLALDDVAVLGPPRSGRSTALAAIAHQVAAAGRGVLACGPRRSALAASVAVDRWFSLDGASSGLAGLADLAADTDPDRPPVLLIDGVELLDDPSFDAASSRLVAAGLPLAAAATSLRGYGTNPLWQRARRARSLILLGPPAPVEMQELAGVAFAVRPGVARSPGRAVALVDGHPRLVQITNALAAEVARSGPHGHPSGGRLEEVGVGHPPSRSAPP